MEILLCKSGLNYQCFVLNKTNQKNKICKCYKKKALIISAFFCREEGIRTLDTVTRILPFQGSSFNHSDTSLFEIAKIGYFI